MNKDSLAAAILTHGMQGSKSYESVISTYGAYIKDGVDKVPAAILASIGNRQKTSDIYTKTLDFLVTTEQIEETEAQLKASKENVAESIRLSSMLSNLYFSLGDLECSLSYKNPEDAYIKAIQHASNTVENKDSTTRLNFARTCISVAPKLVGKTIYFFESWNDINPKVFEYKGKGHLELPTQVAQLYGEDLARHNDRREANKTDLGIKAYKEAEAIADDIIKRLGGTLDEQELNKLMEARNIKEQVEAGFNKVMATEMEEVLRKEPKKKKYIIF